MSTTTKNAFEKALNSQIIVKETNGKLRLEIRNASILWPDFSGKITQYHKILGEKRSFNIVLNDEMIDVLKEIENTRGIQFKLHTTDMYSAQDVANGMEQVKIYYINVKVNINNDYPPIITLFSQMKDQKTDAYKKDKNTLTGDAINNLDMAFIVDADCELNIYQSNPNSSFVSAYLKKLYVLQEVQEDLGGGRWDDWDDENDPDTEVNPATGTY